jgi:hypothetical protein
MERTITGLNPTVSLCHHFANSHFTMTALVFALTPKMPPTEVLNEMHSAIVSSNIGIMGGKATMQAMVVLAMSYERICSTARAVAAQAGRDFVPLKMPQYLALVDRSEHANYIAAVALGNQPAHDDPFDDHLADATDELQASFEALIAEKRLNHIFTAGGAAAILAANNVQLAKIERVLQSLMKDCNQQLVAALCASFKTPAMQPFHHLVNLDFVRAANSGETNFGLIPTADVPYVHKQIFGRLVDELFKAARLLGNSSDSHLTLFNVPVVNEGLEAHAKSMATWPGLYRLNH